MKIAIMQPTYLPWLGYFDLMAQAEIFVFLDNVQFSKQSWQQRNRIKTPKGLEWLTVPVLIKGRFGQTIEQVELRDPTFWVEHFRAFEVHYARAHFWQTYQQELYNRFQTSASQPRLAQVNCLLVEWLADILDIRTPMVRASTLGVEGKRSARLVEICRVLGANEYLSPRGSAEYLDLDQQVFEHAAIDVTLQNYSHPTYRQLFPPFLPYASVMDLILNEGSRAREILIAGRGATFSLRDYAESGLNPSEHV